MTRFDGRRIVREEVARPAGEGGVALMWQRLAGRVRLDAIALLREPWRAVRAGELNRFWLGPAAAVAVLILSDVAGTASGRAFLQRWAVMHGDEPWWLTLEKVPLSLFAPAYLLPCGFAVLQVFVVFGGGQVLIGVRRTLGVALAAQLLGSLSPRLWVWLAPPMGLPTRYLHLPDAGPSVATLAIAVFLVVRLRILWLAAALATYHLAEWFAITGLAQREHLIGAATGAVLAVASIVAGRRYRQLTGGLLRSG